MMTLPDGSPATTLGNLRWRKSTFSGTGGCVSVAELSDDTIAVRDSKNPDGGFLNFTRCEIAAWVAGVKAGEFDDLC